ncbi:MAG: HD domain-containing protein [Vicinamibacterales bacterium]
MPASFSVSDTFLLAVAMLFGPAAATVAVAFDSAVVSIRLHSTPNLTRTSFNLTGPALALWAGSQVFGAMSPAGALIDADLRGVALLLPLTGLAAVYYVLSSGLPSLAIGLESSTSPVHVWRTHFAGMALNYLAAASAAYFLVIAVRYVGLVPLVAIVPLLILLQLATQTWIGRLQDAQTHVAAMDRLYLSTVAALSTAIEAKDGVTSSHVHRVQVATVALAHALGVKDDADLKAIEAAALLHDTGKIAVPERILNKPGKLTPAEFTQMKQHVDVGVAILSAIDFPYPVVPIVRAHHEHWDGSGYPNGLRGDAIPLGARVLAVVDCYDALTSDRPYRSALSDAAAMDILRSMAGVKYDPMVVATFEQVRFTLGAGWHADTHPVALQPMSQPRAKAEYRRPTPAASAEPVGRGGPAAGNPVAAAWRAHGLLMAGASCVVWLLDRGLDQLVPAFHAGPHAGVLPRAPLAVGERVTGWVGEHGTAAVNAEAALDLGPVARTVGLEATVSVPLLYAAPPWACSPTTRRRRSPAPTSRPPPPSPPRSARFCTRAKTPRPSRHPRVRRR